MLIPFKELQRKYNITSEGILHIGANTCQEAPDYYNNGINRTVWVEADTSLKESCNIILAKYPNTKLFIECLGAEDGKEVVFNIANNGGQSSSVLDLNTHKIAHPEVFYMGKSNLVTKRADTLLTSNNIDLAEYTFLNLDVQGYELEVLKGFGNLLPKVKWIYTEVNDKELYTNCALFPELVEYLSQFGFQLKEKVMAGNTGWGDALFENITIK